MFIVARFVQVVLLAIGRCPVTVHDSLSRDRDLDVLVHNAYRDALYVTNMNT